MSRTDLPNVRLLHTSDVHLDGSPRPLASFTTVVDEVINQDVDVMIIAGDLFDHARMQDDAINDTIEQLERVKCPIVVVSGNHDCMDETSIYNRVNLADAGGHVHFFDKLEGEWIVLEH